jgi:hypothetical protein
VPKRAIGIGSKSGALCEASRVFDPLPNGIRIVYVPG